LVVNQIEVANIVQRARRLRRDARTIDANYPENADAQNVCGAYLGTSGAAALALPHFQRAVKLAPDNPDFAYNLGRVAQELGRLAEAEEAYRKAIAAAAHAASFHALAQLKKQSAENNLIEPLQRLFAAAGDEMTQLYAGHALAKSYEDMGDYAAAFSWLEKAKAKRRAARSYDSAKEERLMQAALDMWQAEDAGFESEQPIFIVGMPRTGTSLAERILTSHSQVGSLGELNNFTELMKAFADTPGEGSLNLETFGRARDIEARRLGEAYIQSTLPDSQAAPRFVDKMPLNYIVAPLIARALPNARIICLVRDQMDAALSLYRQFFPTPLPYYDFAYDLANTARAYALFLRTVERLRQMLPPRQFAVVRYEDIVADLETEARRLISFCGLDWHPACLDFHKNAKAIATPSNVQVRQPLYASAVGRWRKYGALMQPAREAFAAAGVTIA